MDEIVSSEVMAEPALTEENAAAAGEPELAQETKDFINRDVQDFLRRHPEVDIGALDNNQAFLRFCGSRYGREPLADLYEDYQAIEGTAMEAARAAAESKSRRATGTGSGGGGQGLTVSQQRDLDEWNRTYPSMKMTAKEFLNR